MAWWIALARLDGAPVAADAGFPTEPLQAAWVARALALTPRVAWLEEALLLEVSACERLWGGRAAIEQRLLAPWDEATGAGAGGDDEGIATPPASASGPTALQALARLRLAQRGADAGDGRRRGVSPDALAALPLALLSAAEPHLETLSQMGCRDWGALRALPRAGVARRFGPALLLALDQAWGSVPHPLEWLALPPVFEAGLDLPAPARSADALLWAAERLLKGLAAWLQARQVGVLALQWRWGLDERRRDGVELPTEETLLLRTAEPMQDMRHLRRLLAERLARTPMLAPASSLALRTVEVAAPAPRATSLWPTPSTQGSRAQELAERLAARLGESRVVHPVLRADHRPERMQRWSAGLGAGAVQARAPQVERPAAPSRPAPAPLALAPEPVPSLVAEPAMVDKPDVVATRPPQPHRRVASPSAPAARRSRRHRPDLPVAPNAALHPTWLLPRPEPLAVHEGLPRWHGPLQLLTRAQRLEIGWWDGPGGLVVRDYFVARDPRAGLLWVFREGHRAGRPEQVGAPVAGGWRWLGAGEAAAPLARSAWFLQGLF